MSFSYDTNHEPIIKLISSSALLYSLLNLKENDRLMLKKTIKLFTAFKVCTYWVKQKFQYKTFYHTD